MRLIISSVLATSFCLCCFTGCSDDAMTSPAKSEMQQYLEEHPEAKSTGKEPAGINAVQETPQ